MSNREKFLNRMLLLLVKEWGQENVMRSLTAISEDPQRFEWMARPTSDRRRVRRAKPTAVNQIENGGYLGGQRDALLRLAEMFDRREFLPNTSDVREFMYSAGEGTRSIKDRSDAFRVLLKYLSQLSPERIEQISRNALHSGPSQLGPLSEAIANVGSSRIKHPYSGEAV